MGDTVLNDATGFDVYIPYKRTLIGMLDEIAESETGVQQVFDFTDEDRLAFSLNMTNVSSTVRDNIAEFYFGLPGRKDTFLFYDPADYVVTRQNIGTGDGVEDTFQLIQTKDGISSYDRKNIIAASYSVWANTVLQEDTVKYNLGLIDSGNVVFTGGNIPGAVAIEAAYSYLRRCRFINKWEDVQRNFNGLGFNLLWQEIIV